MSDNLSGDSSGKTSRCNLRLANIFGTEKVFSIDVSHKLCLNDLRIPVSKFLNAPLFAKKLEFFYKAGDSLKAIDPLKPIGDQEEIIDFKTSPIEIDVKIEHIGA